MCGYGMAWSVLNAEMMTQGFSKLSKYKIFELFKYINKNIKQSS